MTIHIASKAGKATEYRAESTITFANTTGTVPVFTVTGMVQIKLVPECTTNVASAAAADIELGVSTDPNAMIAATTATDLDATNIWIDASPDSNIEALSTSRDYIIGNSDNVIMTLSGQVDSGVLVFRCFWKPISTDGMVAGV
jgi:hypothetical protein